MHSDVPGAGGRDRMGLREGTNSTKPNSNYGVINTLHDNTEVGAKKHTVTIYFSSILHSSKPLFAMGCPTLHVSPHENIGAA